MSEVTAGDQLVMSEVTAAAHTAATTTTKESSSQLLEHLVNLTLASDFFWNRPWCVFNILKPLHTCCHSLAVQLNWNLEQP